MRLRQLIILTGLSLLLGCRFSFNETGAKISESEDSLALILTKKALVSIQEKNYDSLKILIDDIVLKKTKPEQISWTINEGEKILKNYMFPNDSLILKSQSIRSTPSGVFVITTLSLPFQNIIHKDSIKYFHFTIINNKIQNILINSFHPGMNIIEPKRTEPHLHKIKLNTENIRWFRIWYDDGCSNNKKYGLNTGYYAVSGNKEKLKRIGVQAIFQELFDLIGNVTYDSIDFKYLRENEIGDPEWIYLRMRFDNEEYNDLGEFEISYYIKEEDGKKEELSNYIVIKHTEKTRYLLLKDKHPEIIQKLTEIAHHDYKKYYEIDP